MSEHSSTRPAKRHRHDQADGSGPVAMNDSSRGSGSGPSSASASVWGAASREAVLEEYRRHWKGAWQDTRCLQTLSGHSSIVAAVAVLDADRIVSGSYDKTLKVWNVTDRRRHMAALQINRHWRDAISNPERKLCRKWLMRWCNE
mgnify:CR=1 FL=1